MDSQTSLARQVQDLIRVSNTGELLLGALKNGSKLIVLLPPKALIEEFLRQGPPAEAIKVTVLFHVLEEKDFADAVKKCAESDFGTRVATVSRYMLELDLCAPSFGGRPVASNVLKKSDFLADPVKVQVGQSGETVTVYQINRVLMPIPDYSQPSSYEREFASSSINESEFASAGASLNYVGPDLKIEYDAFLKDPVGFGIFSMESIRQTLLAASRVAYGSTVVAGKVISKASDYDEKMFTFALARVNLISTQVTTTHAGGFSGLISAFLAAVMKAWPYLKGKANAGKGIELVFSGTQKNESGYKEALLVAGFGKKKLIGKQTAVVSELEPIMVLLGTTVGSQKAARVLSDFFIGFAYMLENNWKAANNWFDDAAEHGHEWITSEWKK